MRFSVVGVLLITNFLTASLSLASNTNVDSVEAITTGDNVASDLTNHSIVNTAVNTTLDKITVAKELAAIIDAVPIRRVPPKFPVGEARNGIDGWVQVSFIVEPDGSTSNAIIENSSGRRGFEKEALKAIQKWRYQPAMENGQAIQQCNNSVQLDFSMMRKKDGVSKDFYRLYSQFNKAFESKDARDIEELAERLKTHRIKALQESYYQYTALARYAEYKNDNTMMLSYLNKAFGFSGSSNFFKQKRKQQAVTLDGAKVKPRTPTDKAKSKRKKRRFAQLDSMLYPLLHQKLVLELELSQIGDALKTVNYLLLLDSASDNHAAYVNQKKLIMGIIDSEQPIVVQGDIGEGDFWHRKLLRQQFRLAEVSGSLNKLDVRCRNKRHVYTVNEQSVWTLPSSWQGCSVYIYGDDNTQFKFVELATETAKNTEFVKS